MKQNQTISQKQINLWLENEKNKIDEMYDNYPDKKPQMYSSNEEALSALRETKNQVLQAQVLNSGKRKLSPEDCLEIFSKTVAFVLVKGTTTSVAVYDYDRHIYSFSNDFLTACIVELQGIASRSSIDMFLTSLIGKEQYASFYNLLPSYKIAVGNGIFNMLTKELEPFDPRYTVMTKIATNYNKNAESPVFEGSDFTFEKMFNDFCNNKPQRKRLLHQINLSIITGINISPALFIIIGKGGDGKSTYFQMMANILGHENVAYVNFSDMNSPDKMLECLNKKLMVGLDNDSNVYIKKTAQIKSMSTHETMTFSRKYLTAVSAPFTPAVVQLCNQMPRVAETGNSMKRRLISFNAENSYYAQGTFDRKVDSVYIKDKRFLEYVLKSIVESNEYYADFNDYDKEIVNASLENEDVIGQFVKELETLNILGDVNEMLPTSHLYAIYQDWMQLVNAGGRSTMHASRGFTQIMQEKLADYGYEILNKNPLKRPGSLEADGKYNTLTLDSFKNGEKFKMVSELNHPSKYFVKTGPAKKMKDVSRNDYEIQDIEYFGIKNEIFDFITNELKTSIELGKDIDQSNKFIDENNESDKLSIDVNLLSVYKNKEKLSNYINMLKNIIPKMDESDVKNYLEEVINQIKNIAYSLKNTLIVGKILEAESLSDTTAKLNIILNILEKLLSDLNKKEDKA